MTDQTVATGPIVASVNEQWRALAGKRAQPDVSLLDQGADSLLLVALLGAIDDEFGVHVTAEELLACPTIDGLALLINQRRT